MSLDTLIAAVRAYHQARTAARRRQIMLDELAAATHPVVWSWLIEAAQQRHDGDVRKQLARLAERAWLHSHPERGVCAGCGRVTHYSTVDRLCAHCLEPSR